MYMKIEDPIFKMFKISGCCLGNPSLYFFACYCVYPELQNSLQSMQQLYRENLTHVSFFFSPYLLLLGKKKIKHHNFFLLSFFFPSEFSKFWKLVKGIQRQRKLHTPGYVCTDVGVEELWSRSEIEYQTNSKWNWFWIPGQHSSRLFQVEDLRHSWQNIFSPFLLEEA